MKVLLAGLMASLAAAATITEGEELVRVFVPQAQEAAAKYTLRAVAQDARYLAMLDGAGFTSDYFDDALAETPNAEALVLIDGGVRWSDGQSCWQVVGGPVAADDVIVEC